MTQTNSGQARGGAGSPGGSLHGLLALNGALLGVLAMICLGPGAEAQQSRSRGQYTAVSGAVNGSTSDVVFIADVVNQELVAITYNMDDRRVDGVAFRNLRQDAADLLGGRVPTGVSERSVPR